MRLMLRDKSYEKINHDPTSHQVPEGDQVIPVGVPRLDIVNHDIGEPEMAPIFIVAICPADVHVVRPRSGLSRHLLRSCVRTLQTIIDVHAKSLLRFPGVLEEVPAIGVQIGDVHLPTLVAGSEGVSQFVVFVVYGDAVAVCVVVSVLFKLIELRPHGPGRSVATFRQISETRVGMLT